VNLPVNRVRRATLRSTGPRWLGAVFAALLLAYVGVCAGALPAQAAAGALVTSDPEGGQQLDQAPGWVTLAFDGKVDDSVAKVLVLDAKGTNVTSGPLVVEATNVTTQLKDDLPKGVYTVHYRVNGAKGQPRGGAFQFAYGSGTFSDLPDKSWSGSAEEPEILRGDDPNGPEEPEVSATDTPGVEVTSSQKNDRTTKAPPPATTEQQSDDPDDPSSTATQRSDDPSGSSTASAVPAESGVGRAFLIGGIVLLAAVVGAALGLYRSSKKGAHA
jgi:methionine-rich copper-binding protein CopC